MHVSYIKLHKLIFTQLQILNKPELTLWHIPLDVQPN